MHPKNKIDATQLMDARLLQVLQKEADKTAAFYANRATSRLSSKDIYERVHTRRGTGKPEMAAVQHTAVSGPHGDIPVRIYTPLDATHPAPVICFVHGGGFVVGSLNTHDGIMRCLAEDTNAIVIGIDYRLAPTHRFPVPVEETCAVLEALHHGTLATGLVDPTDVSLAGDSAGATIACGAFLALRDARHAMVPYIRALLFYYGLFGLKDSMSGKLHGGWWDGMTEADMARYLKCYIDDKDRDHPHFNIFESDLSWGMPPVYVLACSLDPLLDDSRALHAVLTRHAVPCRLQVLPRMTHACLYYYDVLPEARAAMRNAAQFWRARFSSG